MALLGMTLVPYQLYSLARALISEKLNPLGDGLERHFARGNERIVFKDNNQFLGLEEDGKIRVILGELKNKGRIYKPAVLINPYATESFQPTSAKTMEYYDIIPEIIKYPVRKN